MLNFVFPTAENCGDVQSFYDEITANGGYCIGIGNYKNYGLWLNEMKNRYTGENLPKGYVRENFYLCYDAGVLVGVFSLKFELTDFLLSYGGHIGYAVRNSQRNRGVATQILKYGLQLAKQFGFGRVLCVCDEDIMLRKK